jgi:DNA repair protein RecN (Recombination protein N)
MAVLLELRLANLAVVQSARLSLLEGLNVLTGSTGAGKSLVIEALRWLCGERIDHGLLRPGAELAYAEAIFDLRGREDLESTLRELGIEAPADGLLRLRRELRPGGRSRALLGSDLTTASVLAALMARLVSLQSQHEQLALLDPTQHVRLLDACGTQPELLQQYAAALAHERELREQVANWRARRERLLAEREFLEFQCRELEAAGLREGEAAKLRERVQRLSGGARLLRALAAAQASLADEDTGAVQALGKALGALETEAQALPESGDWIESLRAAAGLIEDVQREIGRQLDSEPDDPAELDRLQERLHGLEGLARKYGRSEAELIGLRERLRADLDGLGSGEELPAELAAQAERAREELTERAEALLRARRSVARAAAASAQPLLERLGLPGASLEFELVPRSDKDATLRVGGATVRAQADGTHGVRILIRTNRGASLAPIERVASGGELSRIGLVLRCLSTLVARPLLLILDEVDSGLGADLGPALATTLSELSRGEQVLVITHLPAVAAAARRHFVVRKDPGRELAVSEVECLSEAARERELARMLGGDGAQELRLARSLLRAAERAA